MPPPASRSEEVLWSGRAFNVPLLAGALALSALGVAVLAVARDVAGWPILLGGPLLAVWGLVRVRVSAAAVLVRLGLFPWPRLTVPLAEVTAASVGYARPARYGGWGLRGRDGLLIVLVRRGDALRLTKQDGTAFMVSVDDAAGAVAALQSRWAAGTEELRIP